MLVVRVVPVILYVPATSVSTRKDRISCQGEAERGLSQRSIQINRESGSSSTGEFCEPDLNYFSDCRASSSHI